MQIYQAEIEVGLEKVLSAQSSFVYASLVEKSPNSPRKASNLKISASISDKDLYYTQSILVTTSWNKNDDIFDKEEVWTARTTPTHKPTNLEHNENMIVGHITSNWPILDDGEIISEDILASDLPNKFHILTGSVIYTGYTEGNLQERTSKLIAEIEAGTKYVSMECFFKGFDYGLINNATGEYKILARNEETAYLTRHLRAYGGLGEHQNFKVGRVLREITFSGKGFVDKPANPESIIFTEDNLNFDQQLADIEKAKEKRDNFNIEGVLLNQANLKEKNMNKATIGKNNPIIILAHP